MHSPESHLSVSEISLPVFAEMRLTLWNWLWLDGVFLILGKIPLGLILRTSNPAYPPGTKCQQYNADSKLLFRQSRLTQGQIIGPFAPTPGTVGKKTSPNSLPSPPIPSLSSAFPLPLDPRVLEADKLLHIPCRTEFVMVHFLCADMLILQKWWNWLLY